MTIKRMSDQVGLPPEVRKALSYLLWGWGTEAPVNGSTGRGSAEKGTVYLDISNGFRYTNTGLKSSPQWSKGFPLGQDANGLPAMIFVGAAANDAAIVAEVGADTLWADGSMYVQVLDGTGKLFIKIADLWTSVT
jgi:hypothetical protein